MDELDNYLNSMSDYAENHPNLAEDLMQKLQEISHFFGRAVVDGTPESEMIRTIDPITIRLQGKELGLTPIFLDELIRSRIKVVK